jgi:hypothetical protein
LSLNHFEPQPHQKYATRQNGYPNTPVGIIQSSVKKNCATS